MNTVEVLEKARALIESGWCQGTYAQDVAGMPVSSTSGTACRWCMVGALNSVDPERAFRLPVLTLLEELTASERPDQRGVAAWNDAPGRTQADILALFDRAIASEKARQP